MKALIWIACIGAFAGVEAASVLMTGHELGVTPTIVLAAACFLLARVLSLRVDEGQRKRRAEERRQREQK